MKKHFEKVILESMSATALTRVDRIQELWSGYGEIVRFQLEEGKASTVVVKHVKFPNSKNHPRGWNSDFSHERKLKSYEVETAWYSKWSKQCDDLCRIPQCFAFESEGDEVLIVLEDLDASGFDRRRSSVSMHEINVCLKWLANFHATFMGEEPEGLWPIGTYWHLDTRPDELKALEDKALKKAAKTIDKKLNGCQYKTFVHGDAKLANFCFSKERSKVAAVDFQYVGGGCGMKDVAYFIGSCLHEDDCESYEPQLLDAYFTELAQALIKKEKDVNFKELETEWREMFPLAWTDFHRFMKGWSPGHWKINSYSERLARKTVEQL